MTLIDAMRSLSIIDEALGASQGLRRGGTIVLVGNIFVEPRNLDSLIAEFGWLLKRTANFGQLRELSQDEEVTAVLFDPQALNLSCIDAVNSVLDAVSNALPIVCHRFSDRIHWPELANAGAFHALPLPLDETELRQSLGFLYAAKSRDDGHLIRLRPMDRARSMADLNRRARAAGSAA